MRDNLRTAQDDFNKYAAEHWNQLRENNDRVSFLRTHFAKDPVEMEKHIEALAQENDRLTGIYMEKLAAFQKENAEYMRKRKPWAKRSDSLLATQAYEMKMFGDLDPTLADRHAKERGENIRVSVPSNYGEVK